MNNKTVFFNKYLKKNRGYIEKQYTFAALTNK